MFQRRDECFEINWCGHIYWKSCAQTACRFVYYWISQSANRIVVFRSFCSQFIQAPRDIEIKYRFYAIEFRVGAYCTVRNFAARKCQSLSIRLPFLSISAKKKTQLHALATDVWVCSAAWRNFDFVRLHAGCIQSTEVTHCLVFGPLTSK